MKTLSQYVKVRVGSAHPHEGGTLVDVAGAVRHPKFEEEPVPHADIALLKLVENLGNLNFYIIIGISIFILKKNETLVKLWLNM